MEKYSKIKAELDELIVSGDKLFEAIGKCDIEETNNFRYFVLNYEQWYSKAYACINILLPNRIEDFTKQYRNDRRKELNTPHTQFLTL